MVDTTNIAVFWREYQQERLLQHKDYPCLQKSLFTDTDLKAISELKNKKEEFLLNSYSPGYLVANLGPEAFGILEKVFSRHEKMKKGLKKATFNSAKNLRNYEKKLNNSLKDEE
jgi:hypothetical protein